LFEGFGFSVLHTPFSSDGQQRKEKNIRDNIRFLTEIAFSTLTYVISITTTGAENLETGGTPLQWLWLFWSC
jgi:hypothetical protein